MNKTYNIDTRIIDLTLGQFVEFLHQMFPQQVASPPEKVTVMDFTADKYVRGLAGIAKFLGCSKTTANRLKQSGKINKAIHQKGNIIMCDTEILLQLMKKK